MSSSENSLTRHTLMQEMDKSWNELQTYLASLTEAQLTGPTDAAGWTAKDHVIHIAAWENAGLGLLNGTPKRETLTISPEVWEQDDDPINAVLQARYHDMPLAEVMQTLRETHERMVRKIETMTDEDLQRPHSYYHQGSGREHPIIRNVMADTAEHYRDHMPWIAAIVEKA